MSPAARERLIDDVVLKVLGKDVAGYIARRGYPLAMNSIYGNMIVSEFRRAAAQYAYREHLAAHLPRPQPLDAKGGFGA